MTRTPKTEKVLDAALALLETEGELGLTMRQVAVRAGMSLSNVQYYFKTRDELLKALADRYFAACLVEIRDIALNQSPDTVREDVETLLRTFLQHGMEVTEMCRIFREYWAIATRNSSIEDYIAQYYRDVVVALSDLLRPMAKSERGLSKAVAIFIPYCEGYSITALSMPEDMESVIALLAPLMVTLLEETEAQRQH